MASALNKLKRSVTNWFNPNGVVMAVFSLNNGDKGICQYPLVKSSVE